MSNVIVIIVGFLLVRLFVSFVVPFGRVLWVVGWGVPAGVCGFGGVASSFGVVEHILHAVDELFTERTDVFFFLWHNFDLVDVGRSPRLHPAMQKVKDYSVGTGS